MANPNILDATSVKYFNLVESVALLNHTPSTSATSDYQTKTLVLKNLVNSGKVLKINRLYYSLQRVYSRTTTGGVTFNLHFITDYTASDIVDRTYSFATSPYYTPTDDGFSKSVIISPSRTIGAVGSSTFAKFLTILPSQDTTLTGLFDQFITNEYLYLNEGQALAIWANGYGGETLGTGETEIDHRRQSEYFLGRARVHIQYEEYTG